MASVSSLIIQTESPVMIQPFLKDMTMSELHAIMVGGFATIAGSVYGAYVKFGVSLMVVFLMFLLRTYFSIFIIAKMTDGYKLEVNWYV